MKGLTAILVLIICFSFSANADVHLQKIAGKKSRAYSQRQMKPLVVNVERVGTGLKTVVVKIFSASLMTTTLSNVSCSDITSLLSAFPYLPNRRSMESASFVSVFEQPPEYSLSLLSSPIS